MDHECDHRGEFQGLICSPATLPAHVIQTKTPSCGSMTVASSTTGPDGAFEFDVFVHDTDTITLAAQKPGYGTAERRILGVDCFGSCSPVDLVLLKSATPVSGGGVQ